MPDSFAEGLHAEAFLVSESNWSRSRDNVTILAGSSSDRVLTAGMVLGARLSGTAAAAAFSGNTGNGTMGSITVSGAAKDGVHKLTIIDPVSNAGAFQLEDPDGNVIATGDVAGAFSGGGLAFTLADGSTDFLAGDGFTITVTQTARKHLQFDQDASTGELVPSGILLADITALENVDNEAAILVRDAEVNESEIVWPSDITAAEKVDGVQGLADLGIIVR